MLVYFLIGLILLCIKGFRPLGVLLIVNTLWFTVEVFPFDKELMRNGISFFLSYIFLLSIYALLWAFIILGFLRLKKKKSNPTTFRCGTPRYTEELLKND